MLRGMKPIFIGIALVLALIASTYLLQARDTSAIRVGYVSPLTGDAATYGVPMKNVAVLATEEINAAGGIRGRKLELIYEDSKCSGRHALSAVQKLVSVNRVKWLSGFTCAEDLLTAAPVIENERIIALAPGASGPSVSQAGDFIFQTNPSATLATRLLAERIRKDHSQVAVISEETGFATDIDKYFKNQFTILGGQVVASEVYIPETKDFRAPLAKIRETQPTAIFVNPQTEIAGGLILKQARELGINAQFYGLDTLSGPTVLELSGDAAEGTTFVTVPDLDPTNEKANAFLAKYRERFGEPPFPLYLAAVYDSVYLLAQAIEEAGDSPEKVKEYLYKIPEYKGAVGTYRFDAQGDIVGLNFIVKKVQGGKLVIEE